MLLLHFLGHDFSLAQQCREFSCMSEDLSGVLYVRLRSRGRATTRKSTRRSSRCDREVWMTSRLGGWAIWMREKLKGWDEEIEKRLTRRRILRQKWERVGGCCSLYRHRQTQIDWSRDWPGNRDWSIDRSSERPIPIWLTETDMARRLRSRVHGHNVTGHLLAHKQTHGHVSHHHTPDMKIHSWVNARDDGFSEAPRRSTVPNNCFC